MRNVGYCIATLASVLACTISCSSNITEEQSAVTVIDDITTGEAQTEQVGRFAIHVDMSDPAAPVFTIEQLLIEPTAPDDEGVVTQAAQTVLTELSISGPGSWNGTTHVLSTTVRLTSANAGNWFDEPWMEITEITPSVTDPMPLIEFQLIHEGSGGVGSKYFFADIADDENGRSVKQNLAIYDPDDVSFNFNVDVFADLYGSGQPSIEGDGDDDRFNEDESAAGNDANTGYDCDDDNAAVHQQVGGCVCETGCTDQCTAGYECCEFVCDDNCSGDCVDPSCDCFFYTSAGNNYAVNCDSGTTCTLVSEDGHNARLLKCESATCTVNCENNADKCRINDCTDGSTCNLTCTNSGTCNIKDCDESVCSISCAGSDTCELTCNSGSLCSMTCADDVGDCDLDCKGGQSLVDCGNNVFVCSDLDCP